MSHTLSAAVVLGGTGSQQQYLYCNSQPHELTGLYGTSATCSNKTGQVYASSYDALGNVTSRTSSGTTATLTYDLLDHFVSWNAGSQSKDLDVYDASGTRVLRHTTNGSGTTMRVYAFGLEQHTYATNGSHTSDLYYYSLAGRLLGNQDTSTNTTGLYPTDSLGSVLVSFSKTDKSAAIASNQVFGPYGNPRDPQGSINTAKGFTGQYNDSLTGLDYYGSRYYDQVAGVFLSADYVQGNGSGENPYGYVGGNPETDSDPSGQAVIAPPDPSSAPPVSSNPVPVPETQAPAVETDPTPPGLNPVGWCAILCPILPAAILAVGLHFLTSQAQTAYTGDYPLPYVTAPFRSRSSAEVYGSTDPTQLTFQPHSSPPQTQTGSGGQGVIPPLPMATAGGFCSFTPDTPVTTNHGKQVISKLHVDDKVLAYNPKTHKMELQPILHVWTHTDHDLIDLTITSTTVSLQDLSTPSKSEVVYTTSEHPFLTTEQGFVAAGKLKGGMHILRADGRVGIVTGWKIEPGTEVMYDLEVALDHTFTVGDGQWVVHNECGPDEARAPRKLYHYTTPKGQAGILQTQSLNPSLQPPNIVYGTGQYLTDIAPEQIVGRTLADLTQDQIDEGSISFSQLARRLYGQPWGMGNKLSRFLEIDVTGLAVENPAPNIFLLPGTEPLDLSGRIIDFGTTPFVP